MKIAFSGGKAKGKEEGIPIYKGNPKNTSVSLTAKKLSH
jgi:hypothetical protein